MSNLSSKDQQALKQLQSQIEQTRKSLDELHRLNYEAQVLADSKDPVKLLGHTPLGQQILAERKAAEVAKQAANQVKPTDKYLEMTSAGKAALDYRKSG